MLGNNLSQLGLHFTYSREDAQGQPGTEGFENAQFRISDGTVIFSADPLQTGSAIRKATYQMMALNGGFKYQGGLLKQSITIAGWMTFLPPALYR